MKQMNVVRLVARALVTMLLITILGAAGIVTAAPPAGHFVVGSGTVTDTSTGLVWQRSVDAGSYTHAAAITYCAGLVLNGGGWRLPTIAELLTIVDEGSATSPPIDATAFPSTPTGNYWSSTLYAPSSMYAWRVAFTDGINYMNDVTSTYRVRCVR